MTGNNVVKCRPEKNHNNRAIDEPPFFRGLLITLALLFIGIFLIRPLTAVFVQAFEKVLSAYTAAISESETLAALRLTLITTAIVVPLNLIFGVFAAWAISKYQFFGKNILITFIDLPFAVSPVIAGLIFVIIFGLHGIFGPLLISQNIRIIFAVPGIVLATLFITVAFVARELIPVMQATGTEQEEAALTLGANGWQTVWHVTLPSVKWGLIYGVILFSISLVRSIPASPTNGLP